VNEGLAIKTVNHYVGTIKLLFKWALSEELIAETVHPC
jgi:hypothetical protein